MDSADSVSPEEGNNQSNLVLYSLGYWVMDTDQNPVIVSSIMLAMADSGFTVLY